MYHNRSVDTWLEARLTVLYRVYMYIEREIYGGKPETAGAAHCVGCQYLCLLVDDFTVPMLTISPLTLVATKTLTLTRDILSFMCRYRKRCTEMHMTPMTPLSPPSHPPLSLSTPPLGRRVSAQLAEA